MLVSPCHRRRIKTIKVDTGKKLYGKNRIMIKSVDISFEVDISHVENITVL